jgi:hypothetical protein
MINSDWLLECVGSEKRNRFSLDEMYTQAAAPRVTGDISVNLRPNKKIIEEL